MTNPERISIAGTRSGNEANASTERDRDLVARAEVGDDDAFAEIYSAYADHIYRYASRWLHEPADAEDVTSETFLRALVALHRYSWDGKSFVAWLYAIAHNAIIDRLHWRSVRPPAASRRRRTLARPMEWDDTYGHAA